MGETPQREWHLARAQGDAYAAALEYLEDAAGRTGHRRASGYWVDYLLLAPQGVYELTEGAPVWHEPAEADVHLAVAVRDAGDGRFVPGLRVAVTILDAAGDELGTAQHPLLWHPLAHRYGSDWALSGEPPYTLRVRIDPSGLACAEPPTGQPVRSALVEFEGLHLRPPSATVSS